MNSPEFFVSSEVVPPLSSMDRFTLSVVRRAIQQNGRERVFSNTAEKLKNVPHIDVRQVKTSRSRTPVIQILKNGESRIGLDTSAETTEDLVERLFDSVPSLKHDMTIEFDNVRSVRPRNGEAFIVAIPSAKGAGPIYGERMNLYDTIKGMLLDSPDSIPMSRCPDLTIAHAGRQATAMAIQAAEDVVREQLPFYVDFDYARINLTPLDSR